MILQDLDVIQWLPVNKNTISKISGLDLPHLVATHKQLGNAERGRNESLMRREPEKLAEVRQITRIRTVRCPCESTGCQ